DANSKHSYRPGNVFEVLVAEVVKVQLEPVADMVAHGARYADLARFGDPFQSGRDIHPVTVDVAVLHDYVPEIDADAELYPLTLRRSGIALGHPALDGDRASDGFDYAWELDKKAVSGRFYDPALVF